MQALCIEQRCKGWKERDTVDIPKTEKQKEPIEEFWSKIATEKENVKANQPYQKTGRLETGARAISDNKVRRIFQGREGGGVIHEGRKVKSSPRPNQIKG